MIKHLLFLTALLLIFRPVVGQESSEVAIVRAAILHAEGHLNPGRTVLAEDWSLRPMDPRDVTADLEPATRRARLVEIAEDAGMDLGLGDELIKCGARLSNCRLIGAENLVWVTLPEVEGDTAVIRVGWRRRITVAGSDREAVSRKRHILEVVRDDQGAWAVTRVLYEIS